MIDEGAAGERENTSSSQDRQQTGLSSLFSIPTETRRMMMDFERSRHHSRYYGSIKLLAHMDGSVRKELPSRRLCLLHATAWTVLIRRVTRYRYGVCIIPQSPGYQPVDCSNTMCCMLRPDEEGASMNERASQPTAKGAHDGES